MSRIEARACRLGKGNTSSLPNLHKHGKMEEKRKVEFASWKMITSNEYADTTVEHRHLFVNHQALEDSMTRND